MCKQHFKRNFCLKRHEKTHYGNEQHECADCHKVYARRDNLEKHRNGCRKARRKTPNIEASTHRPIVECSQHSENRLQPHSTVAQASLVASDYSQEDFQYKGPASSYERDSQLGEYDAPPTTNAAFFELVQSPNSDDWFPLPDAPWQTDVSLPKCLRCVASVAYS